MADSTFSARLEAWQPHFLSILRIISGLLYLEHGTQKLVNFPPVRVVPSSSSPSMALPAPWNSSAACCW